MPIEIVKNSEIWGEAILPIDQDCYHFQINFIEKIIFNFDSSRIIRAKCFCLIALTPLVTTARIIYWTAKAIFFSSRQFFKYLDGQPPSKHINCTKIEAQEDINRSFVCGIKMTFWAFKGIFSPFEARLNYGKLESELNRHVDGPHRDKFYTAICFQPIARMTENQEIDKTAEEKLLKYATRIQRLFDLLKNKQIFKLFWELASVEG